MKHLRKHEVLSSLNHGFRSGYSHETQLLVTKNGLLKSYDAELEMDIVILDFSKAFDIVPHKYYFQKLGDYGITDQFTTG